MKKAKVVPRIVVPGFRGAGVACGLKKTGRADLAMVVSDLPCVSDVVFTKGSIVAAPVIWGRALGSKRSRMRGIVVNAGNANACTGAEGDEVVRRTSKAACAAVGLPDGSLLVSSTGVIGVQLPVGKIEKALPSLVSALTEKNGIVAAGDAILTTDAFPKRALRKIEVDGVTVTIGGVCKGAGMIAPNMGTMLGYVFTDAKIGAADLKKTFRAAVDKSFNRVIVDGDTSTNDTAAVFANGACGLPALSGKSLAAFSKALSSLMLELALLLVRDGEGAKHFVTLTVSGAKSAKEAEVAARLIASSPLVKTAVAGADINWGRVAAVVGRSGVKVDPSKLTVAFAGEEVLRAGMRPDPAAEKKAAPRIKSETYAIDVNLGVGGSEARIYFSDLTHDYISINAGYRT